MENITAVFANSSRMYQAAKRLKENGVIDIQFETPYPNDYTIQVVVETSRYRQAEDIISEYGELSSSTVSNLSY